MTLSPRSSFRASSSQSIQGRASRIALAGMACAFFMPLSAMAAATLQIVDGSGEFQTVTSALTVAAPKQLTMQWTTDQTAAAGGTWQVLNASNQIVASGEATPAPALGKMLRFNIPADAFLVSPSSSTTVKFNIRIQPHNGVMQPLGTVSPNAVVTQVPATTQPPIVFGDSANFPKVEILEYDEKIGVVPLTQIHYAGADVKLRVTNKSAKVSDPAWLSVKDKNLLMRQNTYGVAIPSLQPGASTVVSVHLDAILPPPTSQLPEIEQYGKWNASYRSVCGPILQSALEWRGPVAQTPIGSYAQSLLVKEGWGDYAKVAPNTPICQGTQCVTTCQIEKNIRSQLDGNVMGYSFFVGTYPKFGAGGKARNAADGGELPFKSDTKITVASVSKLVTTIAAVRLLDQKNISLDAAIGPYLPADWNTGTYLKNVTFAQLLGQRSGIKDYGNVKQDYAKLKSFFTQSVNSQANTMCQGSSVINPANPVNTMNQNWCYSNYNTAIMRVLLPKVAGYAEDSNQSTRPTTLAKQYVALVQQNVFNRVGQYGVTCKPPVSNTHAFAHKKPGNEAGTDFGDVTDVCGAAGWYLSAEDMAKVMLSLNARDEKILAASNGKDLYNTMRTRGLGWDVVNNGELEKNGAWGANCSNGVCDLVSTSVAHFGPVSGPRLIGVLFMNSNINGGVSQGKGAKEVLEKAYNDALYIKP